MFVVDSKKWQGAPASGQERLLIELWLEALASDTTALYWPPICSALQTLRNLLTTLQEVDRQLLREYHVQNSAEETLERLSECGWLKENYNDDLTVLDELLVRLRDNHKAPSKTDEEKNRNANQESIRRTVTSFLKAFLAKVGQNNPVAQQVNYVKRLSADVKTTFEILTRAVAELANDLVHLGHSRDHLHSWMVGAVLKSRDLNPILNRFDAARALGQRLDGGCEVAFIVSGPPAEVPNSDRIRFLDKIPSDFLLPSTSPFLTTQKRIALVTVETALDRRAAADQAHRQLMRYLHSTRLDHLNFERSVAKRAAVRIVASGTTQEVHSGPGFASYELHNDDELYSMPTANRNEGTFAELDRVLYWLEQSRRWDDVGRLIALWTALEFLFSKTLRSAAASIEEFLPAYLVPNYARELLLDLWAFIEHVPDIMLPKDMETRLEVQATGIGSRRKVNLVKLLELCLEPDATNPLKALIHAYPIVLRKYCRVRLLDPVPQQDMPIWRAIRRFERGVVFDLRFAFRARNTIVHDAAIQIVQMDRLIQRLNWMLCTALDTLLYQFVHNATLSMTDLHEINKQNLAKWMQRLKSGKTPMPLAEVVNSPQYCLRSDEKAF